MSGLVISLKAEEKFLVNGALLINGSKRSQIRVGGDNVNVLRLSDALHPNEVKTPIRRVYYAAQIFLSGDASANETTAEIQAGLASLAEVFERTPLFPQIQKAEKAAIAGRHYTLLCVLKPLLVLEAELLKIELPSICIPDAPKVSAHVNVKKARPKSHLIQAPKLAGETRASSGNIASGSRETLTLAESPA